MSPRLDEHSRRGWQTHLVDDEPPLFYRPACAAREFGGN